MAITLNKLSGGRVTPNMITMTGLLAHLPIAWFIAQGQLFVAGILLIVFGLFDTLDGELARLQKRTSPAGMFLDSLTDRIKEIVIYMGLASYLIDSLPSLSCNQGLYSCFLRTGVPGISTRHLSIILIAVLGGSLLTSYINAWGEAVMSRSEAKSSAMNKMFRGGLAGFEVRMALIVLGLFTAQLFPVILLIGVLVGFTAYGRIKAVLRELSNVQN